MSSTPCTHDREPLSLESQEKRSLSIMGKEANSELIEALEEKIKKGDGNIIKLKLTRNSLLNISIRVPPEILGHIFVLAIVQEPDDRLGIYFSGLERGSHNFILVCRHWKEVAYETPELWTFWGNNLQDWDKWYNHPRVAQYPVDLVLTEPPKGCVWQDLPSVPLQVALKKRVTEDKIRQIHLHCTDPSIMGCILSALTPDGEGIRELNCIKSIIFYTNDIPRELANFFARTRLPCLRHFETTGHSSPQLSDHLTQTTCLTTLTLQCDPSTTSKLFSILLSNPSIQHLKLVHVPSLDGVRGSGLQVPLDHLRSIYLHGNTPHIVRLLQQLKLPELLDSITIHGTDGWLRGAYETLAPYLRDHFRRNIRSEDRLDVDAQWDPNRVHLDFDGKIDIVVNTNRPPESSLDRSGVSRPLAQFVFDSGAQGSLQLYPKLIQLIPPERVVSLKMAYVREYVQRECFPMSNLEHLCFRNVVIGDGFLVPDPENPKRKFFPSLRSLRLEVGHVFACQWGELKTYLTKQNSGSKKISLQIILHPNVVPMFPEDVKEVQDLVKELIM